MQRITAYHCLKNNKPWLLGAALATAVVSNSALILEDEFEEAGEQGSTKRHPKETASWAPHRIIPSSVLPNYCSCQETTTPSKRRLLLQRKQTIRRMDLDSTKAKVESKYTWHKDKILGEGAYGSVYLATAKATNQDVALKEISKEHTHSKSFLQEMRAMLYIRSKGGHPNLCSLHEHFDAKDAWIVILDYIGGGELFDHLINNGAYSELDASRLVREVASALNFLHGIGVVHADLKPENILLTTPRRGDAVVKLADFGCALIQQTMDNDQAAELDKPTFGAPTPAYCPPESILKTHPIQPSADMWGLGVILFIMLTGAHPYDLEGDAEDEVIEERIMDLKYKLPLQDPEVTGHLSESAKDLIGKLMHSDPNQRLTAMEMLEHPWVRGETAATDIIAGSDERLSKFRVFKSRLQAKFFENAVNWSDDSEDDEVRRKTSLIERSFKSLDSDQHGYITTKDILGTVNSDKDEGGPSINMSDFTNLLSDNIKHKHFPAGHTMYREGSIGNHMYFIDSGTIEVTTHDGSRAVRSQGDFFGEGALLHPKRIRSATVTCKTPVHALIISREYFEKYISSSETALFLTLKEKDKIRKRNRAKTILRLQKNLKTVELPQNATFFEEAEEDDSSIFILESGKVDLLVGDNRVFSAFPGNVFGEHSVLTGRHRNATALCSSPEGCIAQKLLGLEFRKLMDASPNLKASLRDLQLRREFKKAIVLKLQKEFPYHDPHEAFEAACDTGLLDKESIARLMRELNPEYTDTEIEEVIQTLNLTNSGTVTFDEFKKVFIGDIRTSASM
jgi:serine/threonine protein kinase